LRHPQLQPFPPEGELDDPEPLLPFNPRISKRLHLIHEWARMGVIDNGNAERHINTYLALPGLPVKLQIHSDMFVMPIADAPHFDNLPDLWRVLRDVMIDTRNESMEFHFISQALPCFRKTNRVLPKNSNCSVVLCLINALLLGLYPDVIRKPKFLSRAIFFKKIHSLMTSDIESQRRFIQEHHQLAVVAFMEYMSRVVPLFYPVEQSLLINFFKISQVFTGSVLCVKTQTDAWLCCE
jgi:hypothetical protein